MRHVAILIVLWPALAAAKSHKPCVPLDEATRRLNRDVCVTAHVYEVVELPDGTRYLDICAPSTPDEKCRFTIISLQADRNTVGDLSQYRDRDVQVRGIVRPMHGRACIVLSHARQFHGGSGKFKPNPRLAAQFDADQAHPLIGDPNLRAHGGRRSFMNSHNQSIR